MTSRRTSAGRTASLLALGVLSACDIPTETPKVEQEWTFPLSTTTIEVAELLPEDVGVTEDRSAFTVQIEPISFQDNLGDLCPGCAGLNGLTVPKPAFNGTFAETVLLPADVESVQVQDGRVVVVARNHFSFDPLRPPGGTRGSFTLELRDGGSTGPVLDEVVVDGETTSFGPGTTLTRELQYSGSVGSTLAVTATVDSPAGGPEPGNWVLIRLSDEIEVTATPQDIEASSAVIDVSGRVFSFGITNLDVEDVSSDIIDRVQDGTLEMEVVNPWSVGGILNLAIVGPTMDAPVVVIASVPAAATSTVEVEFTQAELQSFLGQPNVVITGQGTANQDAGSVSVTPDQSMTAHSKLNLVILIG